MSIDRIPHISLISFWVVWGGYASYGFDKYRNGVVMIPLSVFAMGVAVFLAMVVGSVEILRGKKWGLHCFTAAVLAELFSPFLMVGHGQFQALRVLDSALFLLAGVIVSAGYIETYRSRARDDLKIEPGSDRR